MNALLSTSAIRPPSCSCRRAVTFFCFAKRKVTKEKATPTIVLILRCSEKSGTEKTRFAQTVFRSDRFFPALLGDNPRGSERQMFDRFAMNLRGLRREHLGRVARLVESTPSSYNSNISLTLAAYEANKQTMNHTFKSYTREACIKHVRARKGIINA
jgi:hypothetical protein